MPLILKLCNQIELIGRLYLAMEFVDTQALRYSLSCRHPISCSHDDPDSSGLQFIQGFLRTGFDGVGHGKRSEEHTSELQSLMRISYAVFCLKKKKHDIHIIAQ